MQYFQLQGMHLIQVEIDPENAISEANTENNKASVTFSITEEEEDDNSSTTNAIIAVVALLLVGFVYVSYRSRRT